MNVWWRIGFVFERERRKRSITELDYFLGILIYCYYVNFLIAMMNSLH